MGNFLSSVSYYCPGPVSSLRDLYHRSREKRKRELDSEEIALLESLQKPKRMKLQCTTQYIYHTLFVEGRDSDVTVHILNKDWKLHKIYLGQSQYFSSMFSGSWSETNKSYIKIQVEDPNITENALFTVLGSFYLDELSLDPNSVVGVLAAATMFQMEGLIEQCYDVMENSVCPVTAVQYYQAGCNYGLKKIKEKVLDWFSLNFTEYYNSNCQRLRSIDHDLMLEIVSNPNMVVIQSEMSVYTVLRKWLFLLLNPEVKPPVSNKDCEDYFTKRKGDTPFLLTKEGSEYLSIFKHLRLCNIVLNLYDIPVIINDGIIPETWLLESYKKQWITMLDVFTGNKGVSSTDIDEDLFMKNCYRVGRVIYGTNDEVSSWRWSGFSFGVDLVWTLTKTPTTNTITLKRSRTMIEFNTTNTPHNLLIKVDVFDFNDRRQQVHAHTTGIKSISVTRGQEVEILDIGKEVHYPLFFSLRLLIADREKKKKE